MIPSLNAVAAAEHTADLRRAAERWHVDTSWKEHRGASGADRAPAVELRLARAADADVAHHLAELDEALPLEGPLLLALVDGWPVAALSLEDRRVVANPFAASAAAVALLRLRAEQLAHGQARHRLRLPRVRFA